MSIKRITEMGGKGDATPALPDVPPKRIEALTEEEQAIQGEMLKRAKNFANNPEYAICKKLGIGACFEF